MSNATATHDHHVPTQALLRGALGATAAAEAESFEVGPVWLPRDQGHAFGLYSRELDPLQLALAAARSLRASGFTAAEALELLEEVSLAEQEGDTVLYWPGIPWK
jgi:hypothetical protein